MTDSLLPHSNDTSIGTAAKHELPPLPYPPSALEPIIDTRTMTLHHDAHHRAYVDHLNEALEAYPALQRCSPIWLLLNADRIPSDIRTAVGNNAGGHVNHSLFWRAMTPAGADEPTGIFADALVHDFGSVDAFKSQFVGIGNQHFGSGWVWLVRSRLDGGAMKIVTTSGHENPLVLGLDPILVNDVWEHAYYLKHANRRKVYLDCWWSVANWREAARLFAASNHAAVDDWESEGAAVPTSAPA
jgi:superoxide dismutase, Fe-Mn family